MEAAYKITLKVIIDAREKIMKTLKIYETEAANLQLNRWLIHPLKVLWVHTVLF